MTRINTNVSSLVAQKILARSNVQLQESLLRLSTGLRINVGKDDPAGLIASEVLRSDIVSVQRAITNSERANQLIATADSALGQVSSLLNDIRGLVSESASTGNLSHEQLEANQLQIDSSLESIDRIARVTSFQGRRLLDGTLDFIHTAPGNIEGTASTTVGSGVDTGSSGSFSSGTSAFTIQVRANASGSLASSLLGSAGNGLTVSLVNASGLAAGSETVSYNATNNQLVFSVNSSATTAAKLVAAIAADSALNAALSAGTAGGAGSGAFTLSASFSPSGTTAGGASGNQFTLSASSAGATFNAVTVQFQSGETSGSETVSFDAGAKTLTITIEDGVSTASSVVAQINSAAVGFTATVGSGAGQAGLSGVLSLSDSATTSGGVGEPNLTNIQIDQANFGTLSAIEVAIEIDTQATQARLDYSGGALSSDLTLQVGGSTGFEVFNFGASTTITQIQNALNSVSDSTGVSALVSGSNLVLTSKFFGSDDFISVEATDGTFTTVDTDGNTATRVTGTDVVARVNGIQATGDGLRASLNTSTLDLSFTVAEELAASDSITFTITGGGAQFQLGPEVVSNQQARIGISSLSTATLGGDNGTLSELRSGRGKDVLTDTTGAAAVVSEVIAKVTQLRGRLGAFQKTTLETNIFTLSDTLENLTGAESSIRDADFAVETARLTRAQILVQSGTAVLAIANSNPQNVLALLQ